MTDVLLPGLPELASVHGEFVDHFLLLITIVMAILLVFWSGFMAYVLVRFRQRKGEKAEYHGMLSHWSSHIEIAVVIVECVLLLGFAFPLWGTRVLDDSYPTGEDVVRVRAVGEKFFWTFHYPGEDGKFGRVDNYLISPSNPQGIDPEDPNGWDDQLSKNVMALPVDKEIIVEITAKDVIHNLALHPMRIAQDAIPGLKAHIWFTPNKQSPEDGWDILCGQLCGVGHANMGAKLFVYDDEAYNGWIDGLKPLRPDKVQPAVAAK